MPISLGLLLLLLAWLAGTPSHAQAPAWDGAAATSTGAFINFSQVNGTATDARGNVFVVGQFLGTVSFGPTTLTSAGAFDLFVAKFSPASNAWVWAQRGGGAENDYGNAIAVSGTNVYITGYIGNDRSNSRGVSFGGSSPATSAVSVNGTSTANSVDLLVAKYTDAGPVATLGWTQVGGGSGGDYGNGIAVSGANIYVTGTVENNTANANAVVLGSTGTTAGTVVVRGSTPTVSNDLLLVKYLDQGPSATVGWAQVGGGTNFDAGNAVAVSGSSVYVTGYLHNSSGNTAAAVFGGNGTTAGTAAQAGASATFSRDLLLAKYTDNGPSGTFTWSQVGGGTGFDNGYGVAVNGANVYVTGILSTTTTNGNAAVFGGTGTTAGTRAQYGASTYSSGDLLLAKYTDNGGTSTFGWSQVGGGTGYDSGNALVVSGSSVYVAGTLNNNTANANAVAFGGSGTTAGTIPVSGVSAGSTFDLLLAKYQDLGSTGTLAWTQVGGGPDTDSGYAAALSGQQVYAGGISLAAATFGPTTLPNAAGTTMAVLARLTDAAVPAATRVSTRSKLTLYPNPSVGIVTLSGATPGAAVEVRDVLGRLVLTATADAKGASSLALPAGLTTGVYLVRSGQASTQRLTVE